MQIESLLTYIPIDRRYTLAHDTTLPSDVTGAALFADISGFTPLTEALARSLGARQGAEELTRQLNRVYDALTEQVDLYGGTIMGFAGDAITCWFDQPQAEARAVTCALALQAAMKAFEQVPLPNGEYATLSLKTAVASGKARRFLVGDPDIQLVDVLAGDTLSRMADAEHYAEKGDVIVDEATAAALSKTLHIGEWRSDSHGGERFGVVQALLTQADPAPWPPLALDHLPLEKVRPWVVPGLREREDETITELRPAVALFLRFQGIDYDGDPDAAQKFDAYFRWIQSIIVRYDGTIVQLTIGDKGSYLYIAFGAPIAHENSPERAAGAAVELQQMPAEFSYIQPVQIGITQGMMRTGAYGGRTRRTYGALGDDVNMAARLMQNAAPGETLVSQRLLKAIVRSFMVEELPPIKVKGKQEPLPIARLVDRLDETARTTSFSRPLVGRSGELADLLIYVAPIIQGEPCGCVAVYGEPGIGKSHLIHEVERQISRRTALTWHTCSTEQVVRQSLHPFKPFLADYFNLELADNDHQRKALFFTTIEALLETLEIRAETTGDERAMQIHAELQEARWFVGALLGLRWYGSPYENLDPKLRFERSMKGVVTLMCAESLRKPLVLHVRDAQWLDEDSRVLLGMLLECALQYPLLVLVDSRYNDDGTPVQIPAPDGLQVQTLHIGQLTTEGVGELAEMVLGGTVTDALRQYLVQKANGNPFFTEQLALDLAERGVVQPTPEGMWELVAEETDEIPVTINAVLIARLDRLVTQVRSIVQIASVLGQEFEIPVLSRMVKDDPDIRRKVKQAEDETIWVGTDEWYYLFRHALLRDAAYNMQLQERLRELHALAGWAIEQVYAADLTNKAPDLAYHYEKSAVYERAVIYLIKSAQHMASLYANREAIGYYQRAMQLAEKAYLPPEEVAPIYEGLADIYVMVGEYQQANTLYDVSLTFTDAEQASWRTTLLRKKGQVLQKWGRYDDATQCYELGLVELQSDLNPTEASQLYAGLSMINYRQDKLDDAIELATLALIMAQTEDDKRNLAQAYQNLGILHWKKREYEQALDYDTQSLQLWVADKNANGQAAIHNNLGLLYQAINDLPRSIYHYEESVKLFEQVGNQHGLACAYDNLGQVYMQQGEQERAIDYLEKAVTILAKIGLDETQVFASMWQAGTW
ncbi:MAG: tetratricopeptide repeat protein [bacterium]|nr:tetratricopeptide repeat protein [bacterium]